MTTTTVDKFPIQSEAQRELSSSVSMVVALISFSMLFATLFLGYAISRVSNDIWPPMGMDRVNLLLPSISTALIVLSSLSYYFFEKFQDIAIGKAKALLVLTGILGSGFLISQLYLWQSLKEHGYYVAFGIYPSVIYAFTWTHAAHLILGLILVFYMTFKYFRSEKESLRLKIKNVGMFWHFLDLIWLIIFITIFVF